ncbi:chromate efflux transporter [uncultured Cohaesibacter sp.]|uniref:chromate efflux transporter n=1 Tax=uncultured Cohaesibacter sp. TaxID=1002546 RepID=UPI0029C7CBD6|nr:chromate efflux transporter [uncultured Cohaesibacter sp.]
MKDVADCGVTTAAKPSFREAASVWWRIGILSFGGPAAQIALMHRMIVDEKKWLTEQQFINALSFCMMLPGPEAMQLATYAGWRLHGVAGGLMAGLAFVLPGAAVILGLAIAYVLYGEAPLAASLLMGIKAAVLVIVLEALLRVARKALSGPAHWIIAGVSFAAIFLLEWPFPLIIALAATYGLWHGERLSRTTASGAMEQAGSASLPLRKTGLTILVWLLIWWLPILFVWVFIKPDVFGTIGLFFSKLATVTFGGAYAVLAYMAQDAVELHGWLSAPEMMDGLGLAETTPGPLILVTEFVGFLAAARANGDVNLWMGLAGALVTLWATFAPCFLWVFAGAPYIEWIADRPRLREALRAITAAVVGVILNLSVWFGLHVLFDQVDKLSFGWISLHIPQAESFNPALLTLALIAGYLIHVRQWSIPQTLILTCCLGLFIGWIGL